MDQASLYKAINEIGFSIIEFSDHPGCFGSWHVVVRRGHETLRIVREGRDSLLLLYRQSEPNKWEELAQVESRTMSYEAEIEQSMSWLLSMHT